MGTVALTREDRELQWHDHRTSMLLPGPPQPRSAGLGFAWLTVFRAF